MKFLEQDDYLLLFPAEEKQLRLGYDRIHVLLQRFGDDTKRLEQLTASGDLLTGQINLGGEQAAVFWYKINGASLYIDTLVSVGKGEFLPKLANAIEGFAKSLGCRYVDCATARKGIFDFLIGSGYYAASVTMRKDL